jgi:hypothetical protein
MWLCWFCGGGEIRPEDVLPALDTRVGTALACLDVGLGFHGRSPFLVDVVVSVFR